ncbi:MAG: T9SS type A sorting domain-containing protein [Bacteroidia bacterium]|nr:T9SS type A sorting domain-containing protein [Bacteroidia bacterium]
MKKKITNLLFLLFFVSGFQGSVFAQCTNSVPVSGNNTIAANSGSICDNGGTSSYAQNSNGYTIINPTVSCNAVSLTFTVFSTESGADFLTIYDGAGLGGTILYGPVSGTPALTTVTSLTGSLTVHFSSNATVNDLGFSANISNTPLVFPSPNPVTATPSTFCNGATVQLNATTTGTSINWYTVPTGGTSLGASVSGANFAVTPSGTTTYYAEAMFPGGGPAPGSQTFNYTGSVQTFTVPTGVTAITIDARGAQGANALDRLITNANGGLGGRAQGTLTVTPGQVLNIYVGGQGNTSGTGGFNGGGNGGLSNAGSSCSGGYAGGGGGASDIRAGGTALTNRVIVAGGGGGAGRDYCNGTCQPCGCGGSGGAGGGLTGVNGVAAGNCGFSYPGSGINGGFGGTSTAGGAGAPGDGGGVSGSAGASGIGGAGATGDYDVSGGGGGGGYFGGGGGGGASSGSGVAAGGGGGGSSYITGLTGGSTTQGYQTGNGQIIISWSGSSGCPSARTPVTVTLDATVPSPATLVTATPSTISCSGATVNLSAISSGNTIQWYTVPTGGASIGTSLSGANFAVSPTGTTTYYAQVLSSCNGLVSASRVPVTVTLTLPPSPNPVTATPSTFCNGATVQLNATTTGTSINWYTVPTGGTSLGASVSGANFAVTPSGTTTYYAEAMFPGGGPAPGSQTFNYTGSVQTFTVPTGVTAITIDARGAQGANALDRLITNANGGLGGRAQGTLTVTPGQVLNIYVGGQGNTSGTGGFNGGGNGGLSNAGSSCSGGYAGGGGGASDIRAGGTALTNRVIVAGGGGGAGRDYCNGTCQPCGCGGSGGAGGGLTGVNGVAAGNCGFSYPGSGINGGFGGTSTAGGAGAPGDGGGVSGSAGASGIGGAGATGNYDVSGGGGGGGYFGGGGGGGAGSGSGVAAGGGGGGSSYITGLTGGSTTQGYQTGNGQIIISWSGSSGCPSPRTPVTVNIPSAPTITCPAPQTLNLNVSCGSTLGDFTTLATTTGPAPISVAQSPLPASTVTGPGATTVTLTATDACNRTATCSFTVNKVDNTAPVSPSIAAATGQCSLTLSPPTTTDNCAGAITGTTTSPLTYNSQGTYSVVWTFNDGNGNSTTATQSVIVDDVTAPVTPTLAAANIQCGGTITPPTTTDNCAGTVTGTTTAPLTYNSQGTYSVIWTFDDGNGNTSTATQSVIVNDVTAPVPNTGTLPTLNLPCGGTLTPPTATDNCAGTITGTTATLTYNLPGTYSVTWTYNDGNGNTSNQTQTVIVSGGTLSLGANSPLCTGANLNLTASGPGSGTYSWTGPNGFNSNLQNPVIPAAPLTASGTYFITASTGPGCNITSSINVHVGPLTLAVTPDPVDSTLAHTLISNCASPYTLYWRRIITGSTWSSLSSVGNTPDITGLLPATAYVAYAVDANGATTTLVYFITAGNPSCGVAPTLTAFVNCNKIFADWSTGALYSQYAISFRQVAPVLGPTASSYTTLTDKVYTVIPANFGSTYEVFVAGYCDNQFSVASAPAYVTVTDPRPVAPTGLTFSATCSSITTNWSSVPGAVGYFVKIKNPVSNSILVNYYTNATTYTRFGLIANFTYEIWVTPLGCGNLLGDESQHFLVQSCTGNAIGIRYQNPTDNPDEVAYGTDGVNENHIAIYPNPNHGVFTVSASVVTEKQALIEVVNMMGQVVYSISTLPENGRINQEISLGDEIAIGTYLIRVSTENQSFLGKFVKSN